jgi:hypothetical protein
VEAIMRARLAVCAAVALGCTSPPLDLSHWQPSPRSPLTGGTIVMGSEPHVAYASFTDLDALARFDFGNERVDLLQLGQGTQPVRLAFDVRGQLHVVLRGTGEIADVDVSGGRLTLVSRRAACAEPRGIAAEIDTLYLTCAGGDLLTFSTAGGPPTSRRFVERDLRDVVVRDGQVTVSTFRSATIIKPDGSRQVLPSLVVPATELSPPAQRTFSPAVAWSMTRGTDGNLLVAYQRGLVEPVGAVAPAQAMCTTSNPYGGVATTSACQEQLPLTDCTDVIVGSSHTAIAAVSASGIMSYTVAGTEPLDVAMDPQSSAIAVLLAGSSEVVRVDSQAYDARLFDIVDGPRSRCRMNGLAQTRLLSTAPQLPHALAYSDTGELVVQTDTGAILSTGTGRVRLDLDPSLNAVLTRDDRGFQLFHHVAAPGSDACATCHPEAGEDGRVWSLPEGARRTQSLAFGAARVAPFHWDGALTDFPQLMDEIFVKRMGGTPPDDGQQLELTDWLAQRPKVKNDAPPNAAGQALFEGKAGCARCHAGERLSNATLQDVGTGGRFKVPSLVGASARLPLMHSGCAMSFGMRFDPACGGAHHGNVASLDKQELDDLNAYLGSL